MSTEEYKVDVVQTYNEIVLSYKKEQIWVGWNKADEPKACYTVWRKSYTNAYMYMGCRKMALVSLFAGQQWTSRRREQTRGHSAGRRGWDGLSGQHWHIYTTPCKTDSSWNSAQASVTTWTGAGRLKWKGIHEHVQLIHTTVQQKPTTSESTYPSIKNKLKNKHSG